MHGQPVIRCAERTDLPAVLALYRHLQPGDPALSEAEAASTWDSILASPGVSIFLAELAGQPAASCMLVIVPNLTRGARPFALIENVVTHPDFRRRGLGRAILAAALDAAWAAGCYKAMLLTGSKREATLRFYEGAGFRRDLKTGFQANRPKGF